MTLHAINIGIFFYCCSITCMLGPFGYEIHQQIMGNVTTNEVLRNKWNAKQEKNFETLISNKEKLRYLYWAKLPRSRLEHFFSIRKEAKIQRVSALDNEERDVANFKERQRELLEQVDNYEMLMSYGIDVTKQIV